MRKSKLSFRLSSPQVLAARPLRRGLLIMLAILLSATSNLNLPTAASALSGSDFNPGRIIDNDIFYNENAMTVDQVQQFLNSKVPNCDRWGTQAYAGTTRRAYSEARGEKFPLTCLRDYYENPTNHQNNLEGRAIPDGAWSAAQIIVNAAHTYHINPQVLITLLQKEQGLVTDDWPWVIQYRSATGYGCPDSAPCDSDYYGFYNQVRNAARQFRLYANNPNNYNYVPGQNTILWNPNASCGSSVVNIENQATASLYNYTPYRPNQAALSNLYGTGDNCSSYGNRNFWRYFNDWFGTVFGNVSNINWNFEQLDGGGSTLSGSTSATGNYPFTLDVNGSLHTFYYDIQGGNLKHAWTDPSGWHFEVVDGTGGGNGKVDADVGGMSKAVVLNGQLYVAYRDFSNHALRLATQVGGTWQAQTIDGNGGSGNRYDHDVAWDITLVTNGAGLHLFYSDATWGNLRHAWSDDTVNWQHENLDGDWGSIAHYDGNAGQGVKASFLGNDIHVLYYEGVRGNLRHAWTDRNGWHFEDLDGNASGISGYGGNVGMSPDFAMWQGSLQAFYFDPARGVLRHAWTDRNGWHFEDLDGNTTSISRYASNVGRRVAIMPNGDTLNVFYHDATHRAIRQAYANPSGWHFANIDGTPNAVSGSPQPVGEHMSISPYNNGEAQLFFFDAANSALRHAWGR